MDNHLNIIKVDQNELTNNLTANKATIPKELINNINKIVKTGIENKDILLNKEIIEKKLEIVVKPELQAGIDKRTFKMDKGTLRIRDKASGKFVGTATLEENTLASISQGITSISGQIQLAEISKKIDVLNEKIDLLAEFAWREKTSELLGLNTVIKEAVASLPSENAIQRINDSIKDLSVLSRFLEETIEDVINKNIKYNVYDNILEGFKVWEWKEENRTEYTTKYSNEISQFINDYGFLLDMYFQTLGLIGTCYQTISEYHHASKYYKKIETDMYNYSERLMKKLIYLLDMKVESDTYTLPQEILKSLDERKLSTSLIAEIKDFNVKLIDTKNNHTKLVSQFENIQLTYDIDAKLLLEDVNYD